MRIERFSRKPDCVVLATANGQIKVEPRSASVVHVVYTLGEAFSDRESLAVLPRAGDRVA